MACFLLHRFSFTQFLSIYQLNYFEILFTTTTFILASGIRNQILLRPFNKNTCLQCQAHTHYAYSSLDSSIHKRVKLVWCISNKLTIVIQNDSQYIIHSKILFKKNKTCVQANMPPLTSEIKYQVCFR